VIPFGPWHPDAAATNAPALLKAKGCLPGVQDTVKGPAPAFVSELSPAPVSDAIGDVLLDDIGGVIIDDADHTVYAFSTLSMQCLGLVSVIENDGTVVQVAGTATNLYHLASPAWLDVTNSGGPYATPPGERWRFAGYNPYVLATNYIDQPQKYDTSSPALFADLGGSPPKARFIGVVRDQVVLAGINGAENALQFSGFNNSELWTIGGVGGADIQAFPDGGPLTGFVGGAVGYVFQATKVTRMTLTGESTIIYQFDEIQGGKGCVAPDSIVKAGDLIYYFAADGFQVLSITTGEVKPLGINKWREWFLDDYAPGTERLILGARDPLNPIIKWAYVSGSTTGILPGRAINYNWSLDEATYEDVSVEAISNWLTSGFNLDTLGTAGNMETLPFSLDSPFWRGGVPLLSVIDTSHRLNYFEGGTMQAEFITADGASDARAFIRGTRPLVDTTDVTVAIAMRERDGDAENNAVPFPVQEVMESNGTVSAHASGFVARAQIIIPAGATWSKLKGISTSLGSMGKR